MKKTFVLFLVLSLITGTVSAQKIKLGVKAGVNGTKISGDLSDVANTKVDLGTGYMFGAFLRIYPQDKWFFQPEVNYVMKQSTLSDATGTVTGIKSSNDIKMQNIEIPLMVGYKIFDFKLAAINALAGPVASFNVGGSSTLDNVNKETLKSTTFSWQAGASVDVLSFVFDVRYEWGITDVTKDGSNRNNLFVLSLGFKF